MGRTIHIIGAGLAGLAAAVRLVRTDAAVVVHEATAHPGGRCRSYFDHSIGMMIDNGNHLVLSGNHAVVDFAQTIGSATGLVGPKVAEFPFVDLSTNERWTVHISDGLPWWIFDSARRVPGTRWPQYLRLARLLWVSSDRPLADVIDCSGPLYDRLVHPLLLAALNIEPREGSAMLASAVVRETLAAGGTACRPLIAHEGLGRVFIEPAVSHLEARGATVRAEHQLRTLRFDGTRVTELGFGGEAIGLDANDAVILAVPAHTAAALVPDLKAPLAYRGIANAHFRIDVPADVPPLVGVLNGTVEWIFSFPGRLSVTISNADRLMDSERETLARTIWQEVANVTGIAAALPPWQIVRERRATFAATPEQNALRPGARTRWDNLFLAGDWTATGLPATLESAVRSGYRAANLASAVNQAPA